MEQPPFLQAIMSALERIERDKQVGPEPAPKAPAKRKFAVGEPFQFTPEAMKVLEGVIATGRGRSRTYGPRESTNVEDRRGETFTGYERLDMVLDGLRALRKRIGGKK